jgi:hypothetical protein
MTGYGSGSPDGLYLEDTGIVGVLTTPGYRPASVSKLKRFGQAKKLSAVPTTQAYREKVAAKIAAEKQRSKGNVF